ncbi:B3 domain-containing protein [Hibiscus syriacus]|uniref:B3 domain-containing protein n=1 Tax=Hibiscus syriacus TaxID=106335 RepID=A0A6A2WUK2_HIBSY|nr:B3 domain-containing protein [Hibiscus syriacus]
MGCCTAKGLVAGFVKTDKDFQERADGGIYYLSADHRLECNEDEERITASGGDIGRLNAGGGTEEYLETQFRSWFRAFHDYGKIGPLRCWPGGLCLSRSIGDRDVGEFIVPVPYQMSTAGGRIIISSDGVWDAISAEAALDCCRGMPPDAAATQIVKEAVRANGLRDDTTCIVIDIYHKRSQLLLHRQKKPGTCVLDAGWMQYIQCATCFNCSCAICQLELKPGEGISVHAGTSSSVKLRQWDGPFLCSSCQAKKEAMEGKRPSGGHGALCPFATEDPDGSILPLRRSV